MTKEELESLRNVANADDPIDFIQNLHRYKVLSYYEAEKLAYEYGGTDLSRVYVDLKAVKRVW